MTDTDDILAIESLAGEPGMTIVDRIENEQCRFRTAGPVSPEPARTDAVRFPVDRAVRVRTAELALPNVAGVLVRDETGEVVAQADRFESHQLPEGAYELELLTQFKTYLAVEGPLAVTSQATEYELAFEGERTVLVGARSNHERPAVTVTTTPDPVDAMAAVETFGSALKTTKPDRSLPSLRGHPPAVELGDALAVPDGLASPPTGVRIEVPPRLAAVYVVAPLAFYLGADLDPGPAPQLVTDDGFEHDLTGPEGFQPAVERAMKQLFFLDCVTRTEGLYKLPLHERREVERYVDLEFERLYDQPLREQVAAYLDVPFAVVEDLIPDWRLTTHVRAEPETVEHLPFVVDDLAVVRTQGPAGTTTVRDGPSITALSRDDTFTRSAEGSAGESHNYVQPQDSDSLEQAWIGDEIPVGASKLTREAFENRLSREPTDGDISITIVLNDARMDEERDLVDRAYDNRRDLPFEVTLHRNLTTGELCDVLAGDVTFLHYIGHTERDGFECADGKLDAARLDDVGVQAFLLNACNSYEQGLGLIESGGIGGIVTLNDVINEGAVRIGETVARLLNAGFPLRAALTIARDESVLGGQYIVVGDGGMTVAQPASGTPMFLEVETDEGGFAVDVETFTTDVAGLGALFKPFVPDADEYFLSSGTTASCHLSRSEFEQFLSFEDFPVRIDGDLRWSSTVSLEEH